MKCDSPSVLFDHSGDCRIMCIVKRLVFSAVAVCLLVTSTLLWGGERRPFPNIELHSLDGQTSVKMEDLRGHPVLLTFWASWCGPCRAELPELVTLSRELKTSGLVLLAINVDSSAEAGLRFLRRGGIDVTAYRMSDQDQAMIGVRSLPTTILLDGDALPVQIFTGYSPGVVEAIRGLVQGMARLDSTSEQGSP